MYQTCGVDTAVEHAENGVLVPLGHLGLEP